MNPVGIYIHVPFCRNKCPYCDFYSVGAREEVLDRYTDETLRRMTLLRREGIIADTVYFGGGTPSLLGGARLTRLLDELARCVAVADGAEITVEANPSADLTGFLRESAAAGVNRLSLGLQSAVPRELTALGRRHSPDDVLRSIEAAHAAGIDNLSLDLMLGIPHQTQESLAQTLAFIEACAPAHISAYLLKIEEGTAFWRQRASLPAADDDGQADLYTQAFAALDTMGYMQYEISNAVRGGKVSRHNMKYWNDEEYIGIGPAAHGFFRGQRYYYSRNLREYLGGAAAIPDGKGGGEEEYVMLRLRLREGLTEQGMTERFGHGIPDDIRRKAAAPVLKELLVCDAKHIALTREGMLLSNAVIGALLS